MLSVYKKRGRSITSTDVSEEDARRPVLSKDSDWVPDTFSRWVQHALRCSDYCASLKKVSRVVAVIPNVPLAICTDADGQYHVIYLEHVGKHVTWGASFPHPPPLVMEMWVDEHDDKVSSLGYYPVTVYHREGKSCLVHLQARDPLCWSSYLWVAISDLRPSRLSSFSRDWKVGDKVEACRHEWSDNTQKSWVPAVITRANGTWYLVRYIRTLELLRQESLLDQNGMQYFALEEKAAQVTEEVVFFNQLRESI